MVLVFVKSKVAKQNKDEFIRLSTLHAEKTLKLDKGAVRFEIGKVADDGETIVFFELWESHLALANHSVASAKREELNAINALRYDKTLEIYDIIK